MRKLLILILVVLILPAAIAEDLTAMSTEDLRQLRDAINLELAARSPVDGALASWDTTNAHVDLMEVRHGLTDDGELGLILIFNYTNTSSEVDTFRTSHWVSVYEDGVECDTTIRLDGALVDNDSWGKKVQPGATLKSMQWFFQLSGDPATVDVEIVDRCVASRTAGLTTITLPE